MVGSRSPNCFMSFIYSWLGLLHAQGLREEIGPLFEPGRTPVLCTVIDWGHKAHLTSQPTGQPMRERIQVQLTRTQGFREEGGRNFTLSCLQQPEPPDNFGDISLNPYAAGG